MKEQKFCCEKMKKNWRDVCGVSEKEKGVGIVQESYYAAGYTESNFYKINFCPWCAANINTSSDKKFTVIEKANTAKCISCEQMIFAKEYQEELAENAGLCFDCQQKVTHELNLMEKYRAIQEKVINGIKSIGSKEIIVVYRAYKEDTQQIPIDNLDEIAVHGKVRFASSAGVYGRRRTEVDYLSKIVVNPTWLDVAILANEMIQKTGDTRRVRLEEIFLVRQEKGIKKMIFSMRA